MRLDEETGHADSDRRTRKHRHEAPFAAARRPLPSRLLHRMGRVEDDGRAGLGKDGERAHVRDERVVAERDAALGDEHVRIAGAEQLRHDIPHVPWRQELALLDIDRFASARGGDQEIGLPAEEGRDLQDVHRLGQRPALVGLMHVGRDGKADAFPDLGEDGKRRFEPEPARA